jgi:hypothetical protein
VKTFCLILFLAWPVYVMANPGDTTARGVKPQLVNPFRNIKTSLYFQYGGGKLLGRGYGGGLELRRFTSITTYVFLDLEWHDWRKEEGVDNYYYMAGRYLLNTQTVGSKIGIGNGYVGGYVGAKYVTKAYLSEDVQSILNLDARDYFEGDITPYTRPLIPVLGFNGKIKVWSIFFLEVGAEYWFNNKHVFKDLETEWKAPPTYSPFLSRVVEKSSTYFYGAIHVKL